MIDMSDVNALTLQWHKEYILKTLSEPRHDPMVCDVCLANCIEMVMSAHY